MMKKIPDSVSHGENSTNGIMNRLLISNRRVAHTKRKYRIWELTLTGLFIVLIIITLVIVLAIFD